MMTLNRLLRRSDVSLERVDPRRAESRDRVATSRIGPGPPSWEGCFELREVDE
jgi:hypothetical protein